jgi:hypothetical protein
VFSCLTWAFTPRGGQLRSCTPVLPASHPATPRSWTRTTDLGEITALLLSWRLRLEASNLSPVRSAPTPTTEHLGRVPSRLGEYPRPRATSARERAEAFHPGGARAALLGVLREVLPLAAAAFQLAGTKSTRSPRVALSQDAAAQDPGEAPTGPLRASRPASAGGLLRQGLSVTGETARLSGSFRI